MKILANIAGLLFLTIELSAVPVFIGTNTGGNTGSKGIYLADFDPAAGTLTKPLLAVEYRNPGFLVMHPTKPVLLAVGSPDKPYADGSSSLAAFSMGADHELQFIGETSTGGKDACHLVVDSTGRRVAIANYGDGRISWVGLDASGIPEKLLHSVVNIGKGPDLQRQEKTHAHGVYLDKANQHLFVPDLGLDRVHVYKVDVDAPDFPSVREPLRTSPGAGPRHMAFSPDEKSAYVVNELDSTVLVTSYENGGFKALGTHSTLPRDFAGGNTTAEIEVSADGRFVYVSNRGHDSIAVFSRDKNTGSLKLIQNAPCGGKTPRHFKIAPGGKWLLCAHMGSHTISVLPIDPVTGKLGMPACTVASPAPICLLFARG